VNDEQQCVKQAVNDPTVETKSYSAGLFDWALSSLYFTAGVLSNHVHTCSPLMTMLAGTLITPAKLFYQSACGQDCPMKLRGCPLLVMKANILAIAYTGKIRTSSQRRHASHSDGIQHVLHVCVSCCMFKSSHMRFMASKCLTSLPYKPNASLLCD